MTRDEMATLIGEIIFLARQGKIQSEIAHCIGVRPDLVYKICKRYGIKTKRPIKRGNKALIMPLRQIQCVLPLRG